MQSTVLSVEVCIALSKSENKAGTEKAVRLAVVRPFLKLFFTFCLSPYF